MRNLNKVSKIDVEELIDYIIDNFHDPLREKLPKVEKCCKNIEKLFINNKKANLLKEIFIQFSQEIINHIDREESIFFPEILNLKKWIRKNDNNLKEFLRLQETEHNEIDNYLIWGKKIVEDINLKNNEDYDKLLKLVEEIYNETLDHVYIENNYLNTKVKLLLEEK